MKSKAEKILKEMAVNPQSGEYTDDGGDGGPAGEELTAELVQQIVYDAITSDQGPEFVRVSSFEDAGIMTRDSGLVLEGADGSTWQLTIVQGRRR